MAGDKEPAPRLLPLSALSLSKHSFDSAARGLASESNYTVLNGPLIELRVCRDG